MFMTTSEVEDILPGVCTEDNLKIAIQVIELFAGVPLDEDIIFSDRDLKNLRKAVAFQSMWLNSQDDFLARLATDNFSADGVSMSISEENQLLLAPLAKRSLRNLSWRNGSVKPLNPSDAAFGYANTFLSNHSSGNWSPLN